jgi:hypothetical protein
MLKARIRREDSNLYVFGLSAMNIKKLKQGMPIYIKMKDLGVPGNDEVAIFYGETEGAMFKELREAGLLPADKAGGQQH